MCYNSPHPFQEHTQHFLQNMLKNFNERGSFIFKLPMFKLLALILTLTLTSSPVHAKHKFYEKIYQEHACSQLGGITEYVNHNKTRIDCLTITHAYEVDFAGKIYESVGQALYYAMLSNRNPGIIIIREYRKDDKYIRRLKKLCRHLNIRLYIIAEKNNKFILSILHDPLLTQPPNHEK